MGFELWKRLAMVQVLVGPFGIRGAASLLLSVVSVHLGFLATADRWCRAVHVSRADRAIGH